MNWKVQKMVFDHHPSRNSSERLLALAIANYARLDGTSIYPSIRTLETNTKLSRRTVQRLIAEMVCSGWLVRVCNRTGRGHTNMYRINPAWIASAKAAMVSSDVTTSNSSYPHGSPEDTLYNPEKGVIADRKGVSTDVKGVTTAPDPKEPSGTNTPLPPGGGADGFDEVFATYPNQTNRSKALRGWKRLAPNAQLQQTMLKAIAAQSCTPQWRKDGGQYVPHFAKWLRNQCWLDTVNSIPNEWWTSVEGIKARGEQLGLKYSNAALGNAYTSDEEAAHLRTYRAQVRRAAGPGPWSEGP